MKFRNSIGIQACIEILKWLRPRVLGTIVCIIIFCLFPIFIIQSFFVCESSDLWVDKLFKWADPDSKI